MDRMLSGNNIEIQMLRCQICMINEQSQMITRCCKLFICLECREKYEKTGFCLCGKPITKKLCSSNPQLFQIIQNYYNDKDEECDRCDNTAEIQCKNCNMLFCLSCNSEVHNGKGFAKHKRQKYNKGMSPQKAAQRGRRKDDWCKQHQQINESICECGAQLCLMCSKNHKDTCNKAGKTRGLKQYREEYYSQILFRIRQITDFKQKLLEEKRSYYDHFQKQRQLFDKNRRLLEEQLQGLKKILEVKTLEINNRLSEYWKQCEKIHSKNQYVIEYYLKKYDDYGRLTEKFMQKTVGLDYLEKRVKRIYINHDFFNFRVMGIDDIQNSIVNLTSNSKEWETKHENILLNFEMQEEKMPNTLKEKKVDLLGNLAGNSQFLLECSQNPLNHRPLTLRSSHNQIQYQFLHLPYQDDSYEIEYGIGFKNKGQEVFKKIKNKNGVGVINYLNPATKYRVRMRVSGGEWGPVNQIKTLDPPKLLTQVASKFHSENSTQFLKSGIIYGSNGILFGVHEWELKIFPAKHNEEETACISIGISNKQQKKPIFVGSTLNYGYHKTVITVKISLNCEQNRLTILSSTQKQEQIFQNLPNFPIYPTVQNKGNNPVQIQCSFL